MSGIRLMSNWPFFNLKSWTTLNEWDIFIQREYVSKETAVLRRWESITGEFSIINLVDNVNWPPQMVSKLTFRALALCQTPFWRRANARNVRLETLYCGKFTLSTQLVILNYFFIRSDRLTIERLWKRTHTLHVHLTFSNFVHLCIISSNVSSW